MHGVDVLNLILLWKQLNRTVDKGFTNMYILPEWVGTCFTSSRRCGFWKLPSLPSTDVHLFLTQMCNTSLQGGAPGAAFRHKASQLTSECTNLQKYIQRT